MAKDEYELVQLGLTLEKSHSCPNVNSIVRLGVRGNSDIWGSWFSFHTQGHRVGSTENTAENYSTLMEMTHVPVLMSWGRSRSNSPRSDSEWKSFVRY